MPECHRCPLDGKGDPRCLECPGPPAVLPGKGRSTVSIDRPPDGAAQSVAEALASAARPRPTPADEAEGMDTPRAWRDGYAAGYADGQADGALRVVEFFEDIGPDDTAMVLMAMAAPLAGVARGMGVTRQAAWERWSKITRRFPRLRGVVCGREERGRNGAPPGKGGGGQCAG